MKIRQLTTCHTCRARKLACDGKKPACTQCEVRKRDCAGYQHDLIFRPPLVGGPPGRTSTVTKARSNPSKKTPSPPKVAAAQIARSREPVSHHLAAPGPISRSLSWPFLDIISLVVQNFSPDSAPACKGLISAETICGAWVQVMPDLARCPAAETYLLPAIKALGVSIASRGAAGRAPVGQALEAQSEAVCALNRGLGQMRADEFDVILASVMCLLISEMTAALQFRQYFVIAEEPWITVPFTVTGPTHIQMIMNSAFGLPCLLRQVDELTPQAARQDASAVTRMLEQLSEHIGRLASLEEKARKDEDVSEWLRITSTLDVSTPFAFPSLTVANLFVLIWTFRLLALQGLRHLLAKVPLLLSSFVLHKALAESNGGETDRLATWILRSIEYIVSERFRLFGAASAAMPLQAVTSYFAEGVGHDEELGFWYARVRDFICAQGFDGLKVIVRHDK
ncbi:uncharacterized protein J7T54_007821 [Emericellopsis cladophorae]|uniref:Zn(2)-C6 fungal-type domain-containing protein n=1 Tax=Emericellopsis cladophorae TaxID=2686198 RepID=A0A9P9Y7H2_9HYPO|nr:uncharacterized protein J7T54_007821 [Emericellopsis cladophorae]KAI6784728.1 hypothetical protein J7T54_007821 [Emericellopsis cladophorae]